MNEEKEIEIRLRIVEAYLQGSKDTTFHTTKHEQLTATEGLTRLAYWVFYGS